MATETIPLDAAKYLDTPEAQAELVANAFETGDASYMVATLGTVARACSVEGGKGYRFYSRDALQSHSLVIMWVFRSRPTSFGG
ncbi:hypothetical protein KL86APRO_10480 [uncultured Alphaproteobacteria bacterium]|uniref:Uncharacterized protein n=1 Tax=uncultured Alphaproteobacteria bacterium TaxID=91750 RepID=A0A212J4S9_9PROT|nr:hypothetical protein KL86APRO_10480 [uncultured Alphaproteobacteria bacterium]